jgi:hypothetical protein
MGKPLRTIPRFLLVLLMLLLLFTFSSCISNRDFANDPVKWSFVGGDGSWDGKSRKWTVYVGTGETKTVTLELHNSGTEDVLVLVQMAAPDSIGLDEPMR